MNPRQVPAIKDKNRKDLYFVATFVAKVKTVEALIATGATITNKHFTFKQ